MSILLLPQVSGACSCITPKKLKSPTASEVRPWIDWYLSRNAHVLRVRATGSAGGSERFEFTVIRSWKGTYKAGDVLIAHSGGPTTCDSIVRVGDEVLVGFNDLAQANFTIDACPEHFPKQRRKLEDRLLRKMSAKYRDRLSESAVEPKQFAAAFAAWDSRVTAGSIRLNP